MEFSTFQTKPQQLTLRLSGALDAEHCAPLEDRLQRLAEQHPSAQLMVDLREVSELDVSGLGALVFLFKRLANRGGQMALCGAQGQPRQLLSLLRVGQVIPMHETLPVAWQGPTALAS
ncbi:STAS domain-containing protein [Ferrimonas marina]|uniref:Anti-sigma factor antagonist n=1 Tax=Ferrimonas marina TaxID=299255 RepID=A0A1M5RTA8_9GAMM|nr:STAS domain-containing protein [Ferrimonas marina]SHH29430.1 anti-anti-sigma factor [Ferrimonas marina]